MQAKSKTIVFLILSFVLGGVAGGFLGTSFSPKKRSTYRSHSDLMSEFRQRMNLRDSQAVIIDSLMEAYRNQFGEIRKTYFESFKARRDSLRKEIRTVLSDEQNVLFEDYIKEVDEREQRYRKERK